MSPSVDSRLVESLIREATARADGQDRRGDAFDKDLNDLRTGLRQIEARVYATEITLAEARGASSGWSKAPPWIALVISMGTALRVLGVW